jgi:hypothetical protein
MNPDPIEYKSDFDQLDAFGNEFYTAADIDENGNIKKKEEGPEEESEEMEEEGEQSEEGSNGTGGGMEIEGEKSKKE